MNIEISEKKSFINFVKSNLKSIFIILLLLLLSFTIFFWFEYKNDNKKKKLSQEFIKAKILLTKNKNQDAIKILEEIINEKDDTYSILSLNLLIDKNLDENKKNITNYFDTALKIKGIEKEDLNLLKLKKAIYISETASEQDLLNLLNPIINSQSVWKEQSINFLADYYFSIKNFSKANQYYSELINLESPNIDYDEIKNRIKKIKQ
tara:strand:- start:12599 stop:13219 length:621 start_codon:yes stop_codon:yes gene_type:complete